MIRGVLLALLLLTTLPLAAQIGTPVAGRVVGGLVALAVAGIASWSGASRRWVVLAVAVAVMWFVGSVAATDLVGGSSGERVEASPTT